MESLRERTADTDLFTWDCSECKAWTAASQTSLDSPDRHFHKIFHKINDCESTDVSGVVGCLWPNGNQSKKVPQYITPAETLRQESLLTSLKGGYQAMILTLLIGLLKGWCTFFYQGSYRAEWSFPLRLGSKSTYIRIYFLYPYEFSIR